MARDVFKECICRSIFIAKKIQGVPEREIFGTFLNCMNQSHFVCYKTQLIPCNPTEELLTPELICAGLYRNPNQYKTHDTFISTSRSGSFHFNVAVCDFGNLRGLYCCSHYSDASSRLFGVDPCGHPGGYSDR